MISTESTIRTISRSHELLLHECPTGSDAYAYFHKQSLIAMHSSLTHEQFILARTVIILAMMSYEGASLNPYFVFDTNFLMSSSPSSIYDKAKRNASHKAWIIIQILDKHEESYYLKDETPLDPVQYAKIYLNFYRLQLRIQSCHTNNEAYSVLEGEVDTFDFDRVESIEDVSINKFTFLIALLYIQTKESLSPAQDFNLFSHPSYFYTSTLKRLGRKSNRIMRQFDINVLKSFIIRSKPPTLATDIYLSMLKSRFYRNISRKTQNHRLHLELYEEIRLVEQALFEAGFALLEAERLNRIFEQRFTYYCMGNT